jgi:hypothetical protein
MKKDTRPGEELWCEWSGSGYSKNNPHSTVYYTLDYVDMDNDLVSRALASAIQRDGVADSLGDSFKLIENCQITRGWCGILEEEFEYVACDENSETEYGDIVENIELITWIEI